MSSQDKSSKGSSGVKKYLKIAGNILMIAALAFVVKKLLDMDISVSELKSGKVVAALITGCIMQTFLIVIQCVPWLKFTRALSGVKIPFSAAMPVYTQSNIYKYLPGNVFQYVGRNKLAADMNISHVDVACATILDILFSVIWAGIFSVILLGGRIAGLLEKYGLKLLIVGFAGVAVLIILIAALRMKFRNKFSEYLTRYSKAFAKDRRGQFIGGTAFYTVYYSISALMYFICISLVVTDASLSEQVSFTGAFLFAWIIGFVTIGAPGGIGIREGVMIFVSGDSFADRIVLFVLVMRISSVLADVFAFSIGRLYLKLNSQKQKT